MLETLKGLDFTIVAMTCWKVRRVRGGPVIPAPVRVLASNGDGARYGGVSLDGAEGVVAA